ncbi:nuclear transport factor 2 family protein [Geodermatophilus sp. SYSU D00703]
MSGSPTVRSVETTGPGNAATVAGIYAAFGRGDVPAILAALADDVRWEEWADNTAQRAGVEHMTPRRGPAEVVAFFEIVGGWTLRRFEVLDIIGDGRQVVAEVSGSFDLPNGARLDDEELHLWTFDGTGRVTRFRHYADTAKHIAVDRGETPGQ